MMRARRKGTRRGEQHEEGQDEEGQDEEGHDEESKTRKDNTRRDKTRRNDKTRRDKTRRASAIIEYDVLLLFGNASCVHKNFKKVSSYSSLGVPQMHAHCVPRHILHAHCVPNHAHCVPNLAHCVPKHSTSGESYCNCHLQRASQDRNREKCPSLNH